MSAQREDDEEKEGNWKVGVSVIVVRPPALLLIKPLICPQLLLITSLRWNRCALLPSLEPGFSLLSTANLLDSVGSSFVLSLSSLKSREIKKISHAPLNPNDNDNVFPDVSICPPPPPMYSHGTMLFRRNTFYNNRSNFRGIPLLKGYQTFVSFRWWNLPREIFKNYVFWTSYGFIIHI